MATQDPTLVDDELLRIPVRHAARFGWPLPPLAGADGEDDDSGDNDGDGKDGEQDGAAGAGKDGDDAGDKDGDGKQEPDWKRESRKHERRAKQEREAREVAEKKLKDLADADKSDQDKAIEKAREEAKQAALSEVEKERRDERLDLAVTRAAAKTFADSEDALLHIRREIAAGDLPDIFDDEGKVQTKALSDALDDLLERKPHLAAGSGGSGGAGDSDRGKGTSGGKSLEDMSVDEHFKRIRRHK